MAPQVEFTWGDLRSRDDLAAAVAGQVVVVHLAFIIPKLSAHRHPVGAGARVGLRRQRGGHAPPDRRRPRQARPPRFIFSSSVHVYGASQHLAPPRTIEEPVHPQEHYARHKGSCEELVRASGLEWAILRFGVVFPFSIRPDPEMFEVPLDNRLEYVHTRDVGVAIAHAVTSDEIWGHVLLIGGGAGCRYVFSDTARAILDEMGVGMLPAEAFGTVPFAMDWLDTEESQRLLHYQSRTFDDYRRDMRALLGPRRALVSLFRPAVRAYLLSQSSHYRRAQDAAGRRRDRLSLWAAEMNAAIVLWWRQMMLGMGRRLP
jgi:nucleoside-diphosphate-sugar epimerase